MNLKVVAGVGVFFAIILSSWLFFWPLVECIYATSWEPLLSNALKLNLFVFGGFVFLVAVVGGIRLMI